MTTFALLDPNNTEFDQDGLALENASLLLLRLLNEDLCNFVNIQTLERRRFVLRLPKTRK